MSLLNQYLKTADGKGFSKESTESLPFMMKPGKKGFLSTWKSYKYWVLTLVSIMMVSIFTWHYTNDQGYSEPIAIGVSQAKEEIFHENSQKSDIKNPENVSANVGEKFASTTSDTLNSGSQAQPDIQPDSYSLNASNSTNSEKQQNNHPQKNEAEIPSAGIESTNSAVPNNKSNISFEENQVSKPMGYEKINQEPGTYSHQPYPLRESAIIPEVKTTSKKSKPGKSSAETAQSYYQLGIIALQEGDLPEAERYFRETLKHTPKDTDTLLNLSTVYIRQKRMESAEQLLKMVRQIDPDNIKSLNNLGYIALSRQDYGEARFYYAEALKIDPVDEMALINLAYVAQAEKNEAEALEIYNKIISLNPENGTALIKAAHILTQEGKIDQAIEFYNRSLALKSIQNDQELARKIKQRIGILLNYR